MSVHVITVFLEVRDTVLTKVLRLILNRINVEIRLGGISVDVNSAGDIVQMEVLIFGDDKNVRKEIPESIVGVPSHVGIRVFDAINVLLGENGEAVAGEVRGVGVKTHRTVSIVPSRRCDRLTIDMVHIKGQTIPTVLPVFRSTNVFITVPLEGISLLNLEGSHDGHVLAEDGEEENTVLFQAHFRETPDIVERRGQTIYGEALAVNDNRKEAGVPSLTIAIVLIRTVGVIRIKTGFRVDFQNET